MSDFQDLLTHLTVTDRLAVAPGDEPLGAAWLADEQWGLNLEAAGYREDEYLISGLAQTWEWNDELRATPAGPAPFTTRVLVRAPADPARFSGSVQLEPHHPDADRALTWAAIGPWIVRGGHAHVGITQEPWVLGDLIAWNPRRYGEMKITHPTQRWDLMGQAAAAIRAGTIPTFETLDVSRIVMSGWSMTGTFCRTFLGEGFHERAVHEDKPVISAYVICISSGNALRAGYNEISPGRLPRGEARRTVQPHGVPTVELLSECESETHGPVLRADSDAPHDPYRLYQVSGTGHSTERSRSLDTNKRQFESRGMPSSRCEIVEPHSDGRMDLVARAVFQAVDDWLVDGTPPPTAARFGFDDPNGPGHRGVMAESVPLKRDADGNVLSGVRTPWVEVPAATYLPHSTPDLTGCEGPSMLPNFGPRERADLIAHMLPFSPEQMRTRYGTRSRYLKRFERSAHALADAGWLLNEDLDELINTRDLGDDF